MKIVYIIKKGFQYYPPCLAQVLILNDLGMELEIYHGKNSEYIDGLLDIRQIKHYQLNSDNDAKGRVASIKKLIFYRQELKKILSGISCDEVLWFGNCESLMLLGKYLENRKFVASILELYDDKRWIRKLLREILPKAEAVICCEKHRAAIMKSYYSLNELPYVIPNKAYELGLSNEYSPILHNDFLQKTTNKAAGKIVVLYQGIISKDRPLSVVANALAKINNPNIVFWIMGSGDMQVVEETKHIYTNTEYLGYIPSPQHLFVTAFASIGIANYDYSNLNNVFCAPNKIYEYAKFGIPMLTSDNIGLSETVGAEGAAECVDFREVNQVKNGLLTIINGYTQYSKCAKKFYHMSDNRETICHICKVLESRCFY